MGQECIVLFILVDQFTQQKDAVLLRELGCLPLNLIDNPVISAVFCTVLPRRGARLILLTVNYHAEYFVCAGSILFAPLNKRPASGAGNLLQGLLVKRRFQLHPGDPEGFDNPFPGKMPKPWMKPQRWISHAGQEFLYPFHCSELNPCDSVKDVVQAAPGALRWTWDLPRAHWRVEVSFFLEARIT